MSSRKISVTPSEDSKGAIETIQSPSGMWAFHLPSSSVVWDNTHPDSVFVILTRWPDRTPPLSLVNVILILHSGSKPSVLSTAPPNSPTSKRVEPVMILVPK